MGKEINIGKLSSVKIWITNAHKSKDNWSKTKKFIFIKITTTDGVEGWGEAFSIHLREKAIATIIIELFKEISKIKNLSINSLYNKISLLSDDHKGLDFSSATSAIEIAAWDIAGKLKNLPLNCLLTDNPKPDVSIYVTCWSDLRKDEEDYLDQVEKYFEKKYGGIKIYPLFENTSNSVKFVDRVRKIVGMEYPLMLDLAIPKDLDQTKTFLKEVSFLKPYWIEEPVDGENISLLTEIKNSFDMKVVTGEKQSGLPHFKEIIKRDQIRSKSKQIAGMQMKMALEGRLGIIIDSTARDVEKIEQQAQNLRAIGYDIHMVFVNTTLEVALDRNRSRPRPVSYTHLTLPTKA